MKIGGEKGRYTVKPMYKLTGHSKEIRDLDFDPSGCFLGMKRNLFLLPCIDNLLRVVISD